jgi:diaminopimelate decarboxylase
MVMASNYNARPLVPEIMVKGDQYRLIRPRQTVAELIAHQTIPDWS